MRLSFNQIAAIVVLIVAVVIAGYFIGQPQRKSSPTPPVPIYNSASSSRLYEIIFNQTFFCPQGTSLYGEIVIPWAVTLGNPTIVEPSGSDVESGVSGTFNQQFSTIVFSVPDGTYSFTIIPHGFNIQSGTITVNGQDTAVQLHYFAPACGSTTTSG